VGWIGDLVKELPVSAAMRERLAHAETLYDELKAKNGELQLQVDELTTEVAKLRLELSALKGNAEYEERRGMLFKKKADGTFSDGPRCPKCKLMMGRIRGKYICNPCHIVL
jgi:DNA repair exonuclease SbcCD ATPase subunit